MKINAITVPVVLELLESSALAPPRDGLKLTEERTLEFLEGTAVIEGTTLKGVKMVGLESPSRNRVYLESGLQEAVGLYEGTTVNCGHLKPVGNREPGDTTAIMGTFTNVVFVESKGLFGDLTLIPAHPMTDRMIWAAENAPQLFCMSHHAGGTGVRRSDGIQEIQKITKVASVDVVGDGGTTKSLFESASAGTLEEGEIRDKINETEKLREIRRINWTAQDLIWEKMFDGDKSPADRRDDIIEVLNDWVGELEGLNEVEESDMDLKKLNITQLRESRPDLVEALLQETKAGDEMTALREENKELKAKIDAREAADQLAELKKSREALIEAAELPDILKTEQFVEDCLDPNTSDERFTKLLEDRKGLIKATKTNTAPKSSAKDLYEQAGKDNGEGGAKTTDEFVEALNN